LSVGRLAGSSSKAHLRTPSSTILCFLYCFKLLTFFYAFFTYFLCHIPWKHSKKTFWCYLDYIIWKLFVISGFCFPESLSCFWTVAFHHRFGRFWMTNTVYLTLLMTYDLFTAINRLGSSTISFILHFTSFIHFFFSFLRVFVVSWSLLTVHITPATAL